jgi:bifunctional UDP-N-acetylglucosamine pyrophosphorylase/glucosamine-1-phosphate N-acetyltransferase
MNNTAAIVLAAGKGTRMKSNTPKVLHEVCGLPVVGWVLRSLAEAGIKDSCLVLSDDLSPFQPLLKEHPNVSVAIQQNRLGTGDAAASCAWSFKNVPVPSYAAGRHQHGKVLDSEYVLICAGDIPAVSSGEYGRFMEFALAEKADLAVLGMDIPEPTGYGRLVTEGNALVKIVEEKDADAATRRITACNTGILFFRTKILFDLLCHLTTNNAQKEYYLTDCVEIARSKGLTCRAFVSANYGMYQGVNDRSQLSAIEELINRRLITRQMTAGVSFKLPATSLIEADVTIGNDTVIDPGFTARGRTMIGSGCRIGPHVTLSNAEIGDGVEIGGQCDIRNTTIASGEKVYPGSVLGIG